MFAANYFDGMNGKKHAVHLFVARDSLRVVGAEVMRDISPAAIAIGESFDSAPGILQFADGGHCEIHEPAAKAELLAALGYHKPLVVRWQEKWIGALLAIAGMLALVASAYYWGIPWAAEHVATMVPLDVEKQLGNEELRGLEKAMFRPSGLTRERQQQAYGVFREMLPANPRMPMTLLLRNGGPLIGANAFALPNGTIIVTDAMMEKVAAAGEDWNGRPAEELAGVLAHEMGHVQGRHALRSLIATSLSGVVSWSLFGDFSAVAAGAPALLVKLEYSREMESNADDYAVALLKQHGIPPSRMADLFERMQKTDKRGMESVPHWMRSMTGYLSTHPQTQDRIAKLRAADG